MKYHFFSYWNLELKEATYTCVLLSRNIILIVRVDY